MNDNRAEEELEGKRFGKGYQECSLGHVKLEKPIGHRWCYQVDSGIF